MTYWQTLFRLDARWEWSDGKTRLKERRKSGGKIEKNCVNRPSAFGETSRSRALDYVSIHPLLAFILRKDEVFIKHLTIVWFTVRRRITFQCCLSSLFREQPNGRLDKLARKVETWSECEKALCTIEDCFPHLHLLRFANRIVEYAQVFHFTQRNNCNRMKNFSIFLSQQIMIFQLALHRVHFFFRMLFLPTLPRFGINFHKKFSSSAKFPPARKKFKVIKTARRMEEKKREKNPWNHI